MKRLFIQYSIDLVIGIALGLLVWFVSGYFLNDPLIIKMNSNGNVRWFLGIAALSVPFFISNLRERKGRIGSILSEVVWYAAGILFLAVVMLYER